MYHYILCVVIVSGALVALLPPEPRRPRPWPGAADTIRQVQAVALLASRLVRGGGIPVPMEWSCSSAAVYSVPGWKPVHPRLIQSAAGSYQDATATKPVSLGASICAAKNVVSVAIGCPRSEWALGLLGTLPTIAWVQVTGPISDWRHDL